MDKDTFEQLSEEIIDIKKFLVDINNANVSQNNLVKESHDNLELKVSELIVECQQKDKIINILTENLTTFINNSKSIEFQRPIIHLNKTVNKADINDGWQTVGNTRGTFNSQIKNHCENYIPISNRFNGIYVDNTEITDETSHETNIHRALNTCVIKKSEINKNNNRVYINKNC